MHLLAPTLKGELGNDLERALAEARSEVARQREKAARDDAAKRARDEELRVEWKQRERENAAQLQVLGPQFAAQARKAGIEPTQIWVSLPRRWRKGYRKGHVRGWVIQDYRHALDSDDRTTPGICVLTDGTFRQFPFAPGDVTSRELTSPRAVQLLARYLAENERER